MSECLVAREALVESNLKICDACKLSTASHYSEKYHIKRKIESEKNEIKRKRIKVNKEIELKKIEVNKEIEFKKMEVEIENINLKKLQFGIISNSSSNVSTSKVKKEISNLIQLCKDTRLSITVSTPNLSEFGTRTVDIIRTDSTNENAICLQFSNIFIKALAEEIFYYGIFSSEEKKWLVDQSKKSSIYKPDLFMSTRALIEPKANKLKITTESATPYFTEYVKFIFEGKLGKLGEEHLGKLIFYLKLMNNIQPVSYGFIFNASNFVFMESIAGSISKIEEGTFSSPGSYDYILLKIKNSKVPVVELYDSALKYFSEVLAIDIFSYSFLGSGKYGKVFSCIINGNACSLKLIRLGSDANCMDFEEVQVELERFKQVYDLDNTITFKSYRNPLRFDSDYGSVGAYLLEGVGSPAKLSQSKDIIKRLYDLHKLEVIHGDPRLPNILNFNSSLCWIDFRYDWPFTEDNIITDVKILMRSLLVNLSQEEIESKTDSINEYVQSLKSSDALNILFSLFNKKM